VLPPKEHRGECVEKRAKVQCTGESLKQKYKGCWWAQHWTVVISC